jgi:DNA repair protein SbcC/Rad50
MRPLRLTVKGFTAFREEQTLDFTDLDVFAISGPTGSGKSSLLDAMTFALYGKVERVGGSVGQLISQGQPAMAVTLDFEVGREVYRVSRRSQTKGPTKIILQRQAADGSWEQAGEGADRVRDVDRMIESAIGLTYDGFTRSVLLPQGRFQEFMVGEAGKRREILTQLLGLSLFRRMAERAGALGREASVRSETLGGMIEHDFAEVTTEALEACRAVAAAARERERALALAAEGAARVAARWEEAKRSIGDIRACAAEATAQAGAASLAAEELAALSREVTAADAALAAAAKASSAAAAARDAAGAALAADVGSFGSTQDLFDARLAADRLAECERAVERAGTALIAAMDEAAGVTAARATAADALEAARSAQTRCEQELAGAAEGLEEVRHANLVATVAHGLAEGDPCPVCGRALTAAPDVAPSRELTEAETALAAARSAFDAASRASVDAERTLERTERDVEANAAERDRLRAEARAAEASADEHRRVLVARFGPTLPHDPAAEIAVRLAERERLAGADRDAEAAATASEREAVRAEQDRDRVLHRIEVQRAGVTQDHSALAARAARALGAASPVPMPATPMLDDAGSLALHAREVADALTGLVASLTAAIDARGDSEATFVAELAGVAGDLIEPEESVDAFVRSIDAARREATGAAASADQRATDLDARLRRKQELVEEVQLLDQRHAVFKQLATELQQNRLVAYLQSEALQLLALAGSERLLGLSDGRYRLVCRGDEFMVVDTWNADEERSVRTLSGGETFLASLALALALAEQVRSLSTTDRARLDSLFLDEGFGTLDQETLRTVVDAIGQLGRDGRLVGVITHVRELADEFARVEVEKSPAGSRLHPVNA